MTKTSRARALGLGAAASLALSASVAALPVAQVPPEQFKVEGSWYRVSWFIGSYEADSLAFDTPTMPWWGESVLAQDFAEQVAEFFGEAVPNSSGRASIYFGWDLIEGEVHSWAWDLDAGTVRGYEPDSDRVRHYAIGQVPEPATLALLSAALAGAGLAHRTAARRPEHGGAPRST